MNVFMSNRTANKEQYKFAPMQIYPIISSTRRNRHVILKHYTCSIIVHIAHTGSLRFSTVIMILTSPPDNFERHFNWHLARPADYCNMSNPGLCFVTKDI